ncbi:hypothetical protein BJ944DRAFT_258366 [Cunninghamella echinulata]|nr:hypothetical protein BJ944DRAFT_258366 [Cunninghamella echinulata]
MIFSNEILYLIFQHFTTRRYLSLCSLINRQWYSIATDPVFYKTIHLYTLSQLDLFLEMATTMKRNNKPIGHFVKQLLLEFNDTIDEQTMYELQQCCPFITFIRYSPIDQTQTYPLFPLWNQLILLPSWYQEKRSDCIETLKSSLQHLSLTLDKNDMKEIMERKMPNGFSLFKCLFNLNDLSLHFTFKHTNRLFTLDHYFLDKLHSLCPTISSLTITGVNLGTFENDASTIYNTHQSTCGLQKLTSLSLKYVQILDPYFFNYLANKYVNLESLELIIIDRCDVSSTTATTNFDTAINGLLNDEEDEASEDEDEEDEEDNEEYNNTDDLEIENTHRIGNDLKKNAIKNMLLHKLLHLKKLYVTFLDGKTKNKDKLIDSYWPNDELLDWLYQHPYQYQELQWPSTLFSTSHHTKEMLTIPHHIYPKSIDFFDHLTTLSLVVLPSTWTTIQCILNHHPYPHHRVSSKKTILSSTITALKLRQKSQDFSNIELDIYDWLDLFPSLFSMELIGFILKNKTSFYHLPSPPPSSPSILSPSHYRLNELIIQKCRIHLTGGLSSLCQHCPKLSILQCKNARYGFPPYPNQMFNHHHNYYYQKEELDEEDEEKEGEKEEYYTILNAPWISLKELVFDNVIFYHLDEKIGRKGKFIWFDNFNIQTTTRLFKITSPSPIIIKPNSTLYYHSTKLVYMNIVLDSLDRFNNDDEWVIY